MGQKVHPRAFRLISTQNHFSEWYSIKKNYANLLKEDFLIRKIFIQNFEPLLAISSINISRNYSNFEKNHKIFVNVKALHPQISEIHKKIKSIFSANKKLTGFFYNINFAATEIIGLSNEKQLLIKICKILIRYYTQIVINDLEKKLKRKICVHLKFINSQFIDSMLLAKFIGSQLKKRVPYRRIVKYALKRVNIARTLEIFRSINPYLKENNNYKPNFDKFYLEGIKIAISGRLNGADMARCESRREGKIPLHTIQSNLQYSSYYVHTIYGIIGVKVWVNLRF